MTAGIRNLRLIVAFAGVLVVCPMRNMAGQVPSAAIKGRVEDFSHAVIAGAVIRTTQVQTNANRVAETSPEGVYQLESLDPGEYEIEILTPGFAAEKYTLNVRAGDYLTVNFALKLSPATESVTVKSEVSGMNTSGFSVSGSVSRFQIENLPLNGRNFLELARLEPAVSVASTANPGAFGNNYQRVSVAGAQYLETRVSVDGATIDTL